METLSTTLEKRLTIEEQKHEASVFISDTIESLVSEKGMSVLAAAHEVYESVKGENYRKEQAAAKLCEYLQLANEVALRKGELESVYPEFLSVMEDMSTAPAANDEKYLVAA